MFLAQFCQALIQSRIFGLPFLAILRLNNVILGIVNDLGGRLTARNASGGGAVFDITLPLYREQREAAE